MKTDSVVAWGLLLVLLSLLPTLSMSVGWMELHSVDVALVPLVFTVLILVGLRPRKHNVAFNFTDLWLLVFLASTGLSCLISFKPDLSQLVFWDWLRVTSVYFVARIVFHSSSADRMFPRFLKIVAATLLLVGALQILTESQIGLLGNLVGEDRDQHVGLRFDMEEVAVRVSGTTSNPNIYGQWVILFSGYWLVELLWKRKFLGFAALLSLTLAVLMQTFSRGVLATFVVMIMGAVALTVWKKTVPLKTVIGVTASVLVVAALLVGIVVTRQDLGLPKSLDFFAKRFEVNNDSVRVLMIRKGWQFLDDPKVLLFGIGPGSFHAFAYEQGYNLGPKPWQDYSNSTSGIHNVGLKLIVEYGILAFLAFVLILGSVVFRLWILFHSSHETSRLRSIYGFSLLAGFGLVAGQVYESPIFYQVLIPAAMVAAFIQHRNARELGTDKALWGAPTVQMSRHGSGLPHFSSGRALQ